MPKVLELSGYSPIEIGVIFAAAPLVRFFIPFIFTNKMKLNIKVFNLALIVLFLSSTLFYFSLHNFYMLLVSNIFLGIGMSLILPYIELISLELIGKEKYGKIRLFGSVGFIIVALVLVKFLSSPEVALNYLLLLTYTTSIIAYIVAKNSHAKSKKDDEHIENDINLLKDYRLWLGLLFMQISFGSFYNFFTIYLIDNGIDMGMSVYLWSFGVIVEIFMLYFQGRFLRENLILVLQITTFATAIRWFLVYMFADNLYVLFFSQSIHALSFALFHSAAISYLFHLYKNKALAQQFFSGITYGLGGFVGALYAGYVYEYFSKELFLSSSILALLACGFLVAWDKTMLKSRH